MTQKQINILRVYHNGTADEIDNGLRWYLNANEEAQRIHEDINIGAAIIAATSPGLRWENNVEVAERIIKGKKLDGLGVRWYDGVNKAKRILKGHNPNVVLKGNKVRAFFECILDPKNTLHCCIDGHAYSIWTGRRIALDGIPPLNTRLYVKIAADYCAVAKVLGISPCQLQAITWVTWRRIHEVTKAIVA